MSFLQFYSKTLSETNLDSVKKNSNFKTSKISNHSHQIIPTSLINNHSLTFDHSLPSILPTSSQFFNRFRSINQQQAPLSTSVSQITTDYRTVQVHSKIDEISIIKQPTIAPMNNEQCEIIRNLPYYVFNFNNNFENEICMSIISDFSKDEKQRIIPRKMNFDTYAQCIHNQFRTSKVLQLSIQQSKDLKQKVDMQINTQQNNQIQRSFKKQLSNDMSREMNNKSYQNKSKRSEKSFNKSIEKDYSDHQQQQKQQLFVISLQFLKLEIENQKSRIPRPIDYFEVMENKLMNFLDYVIDDVNRFKGSTHQQKIKGVLSDIETFKGKKIDGQLKTLQLQYFFTQIKQLKKYKQQIDNTKKSQIKKIEKKKQVPVNIKPIKSKTIKIQQPIPELINLSDKKTPKKNVVEQKKPITKKPEVPRTNIGRMIKKDSKDSVGISTIKKAISQQDSWIGGNQLDL